ncbi:MAG: hypothetical protein M1827_001809 [Pycnora praestabilis]|nr:MAG: hypothetical protein M1827_001809 [Pycnora praestabilis]
MSSLQTSVLVNGEWTTRTMDIHTILARNRAEPTPDARMLEDTEEKPPVVGVMTKTTVRSPMIKFIIPARIRDIYKNDVVFVGEHFVQIKELLSDGHFRTVITKADFSSRIRSARVFGADRVPATYGQDQVIRPNGSSTDGFMGHPVQEKTSYYKVPPQILILALESKEIVFLFAYHDTTDRIHFLVNRQPLPSQRSFLEQPGKHVAVDPKSRAFAVAACEGNFTLYALKSIDKIKNEMELDGGLDEEAFQPIREERSFAVDGLILRMEFLFPLPNDKEHVILLLIISKHRTTRMLCFEWDCSKSLQNARKVGYHGLPVNKHERLPLLLIPLMISSCAFMLVCEQGISIYRNILTGSPICRVIAHSKDVPSNPGDSRRLPLWTQWARPFRLAYYIKQHDDLFLCREDGQVRFLEINDQTEILVDTSMSAGILGCSVDTAFSSLDMGIDREDLLITGGDLSVGGTYLFNARQPPVLVETFPIWAPIIDVAAVGVTHEFGAHSTQLNNTASPVGRDRIFACSGRGAHGAISEMRYGLEARMGIMNDHEDLPGVTQVWTVPDIDQNGVFFLLSLPLQTLFWHLEADAAILNYECDGDSMGLDLGSRTLVIEGTPQGPTIQVSEQAIRVTTIGTAVMQIDGSRLFEECQPGEKIVAAAVHGWTSTIITAVRNDGDIRLEVARVSYEKGSTSILKSGQTIEISTEPSCLSLLELRGTLHAFVGTSKGTLQIFRLEHGGSLLFVLEKRLNQNPLIETFAVCESVMILSSEGLYTSAGAKLLLVCGLRNGTVETFHLDLEFGDVDLSLEPGETVTIGATSVNIISDKSRQNAAFVICGSDLCRMEYNHDHNPQLLISSIFLTNQGEPPFQQSPMATLSQISTDAHFEATGLAGCVVCVSGTKLIVAVLDEIPKMIPRRIPVKGTPRRVMFSKQLRMLVVAVTSFEVNPGGGSRHSTASRILRDSIQFIDPNRSSYELDSASVKTESGSEIQDIATRPRDENTIPFGKPGERVFGIIDWNPSEGSKEYHFLVVITGITSKPGGVSTSSRSQKRGKIRFFSVRSNNHGGFDAKQKYVIEREKPVISVAAYGPCSLVYCCGTELEFQTLDLTGKKWHKVTSFDLRSPSVHMSIIEPLIYVTTAEDSLRIIRFETDKLVPQFSDAVARDGLHHLTLPNHKVILISDKACCVAGLWQPDSPRNENAMPTLFEADLSGSITRLRRAFIRAPWRIRSNTPPGVLEEDILGTSADGSLYHFMLLSESSWRLLRFIQNLCMHNDSLCPFQNLHTSRKHIEPEATKPRNKHVDGDILERLLENPALLRQMLNQEPNEDHSIDFHSADARSERFRFLVDEVVDDLDEFDDPTEIALDYVRSLLQLAY